MTSKKYWILLFIPWCFCSQNKPFLFWGTYNYYVPDKSNTPSCYTEIALSVSPYNLNFQKNKDSSIFATIQCVVEISNENKIIRKDTFLVKSPSVKKADSLSYFGYVKRYWMNNHKNYNITLYVKDLFSKDTSAVFRSSKQISIHFDSTDIQFSDIQFIDIIEKSDRQDNFFKYGYTIVPYNDNYFNENFNELKFTFEIYNTDTILGKSEPFLVVYKILNKDNNKEIENIGGFKKQTASKKNVIIGSLPLKDLPSGNYYLLIEIKDKNNKTLKQQQIYFQRKNSSIVKKSSLSDEMFFGNQNNEDTLKMWLEALWPIANNLEKEWIVNQSITKNVQVMKNFMIDFWEKRAADSANPVLLAKAYYSRLNYVMKNFKCGKMAPYYTDRGRVYMQYGEPNQRTIQLSEPGAYPYEIWQYYRIYNPATNQFFSNRKFVFVNKGIADECYVLIHSDMRGEYNNPNWQREIMKHELYDINNPYQQQQMNYGNNFDKLYQNPQ